MDSTKANNYDLIRLVAALQVVYIHGVEHLQLHQPDVIVRFVRLFPGVPIFYFLSGMLISMSWENNPRAWEYARNRCLRIFPALVVCTVLSVTGLFVVGYLWNDRVTVLKFVAWVLGQVTFLQFFTPAFMRQYATGTLNGSLPTITVELQFYVLVPLTYLVLRLNKRRRSSANAILLVLIAIFLAVNTEFNWRGGQQTEIQYMKILNVSFLPWFYMFLLGVLVQRNRDAVLRYARNAALPAGIVYVVVAWTTRSWLGWHVSNEIHPVLFVLLVFFILACGHTRPGLARRLLGRNDISYGVYLFHMPVINTLIYEGMYRSTGSLLLTYVITLALAITSWRVVEKPFMRLKRHSVRAAEDTTAPTPRADVLASAERS